MTRIVVLEKMTARMAAPPRCFRGPSHFGNAALNLGNQAHVVHAETDTNT
jgi:hypothetical protein